MREQLCLLALTSLLQAAPLLADDTQLPVATDDLVFCTVCHGVQLMGNPILEAPRLSGMEGWYVERQLAAFSNGWRGVHEADRKGIEMRPMAEALSEQQVAAAVRFVAATRSGRPAPTVAGDAARGRELYRACAACHGAAAEGNEALRAPALRDQNDWYLVTQLRNFRDGVRGSDPNDSRGAQMAAATSSLRDDAALQDIVTYISNLPAN